MISSNSDSEPGIAVDSVQNIVPVLRKDSSSGDNDIELIT